MIRSGRHIWKKACDRWILLILFSLSMKGFEIFGKPNATLRYKNFIFQNHLWNFITLLLYLSHFIVFRFALVFVCIYNTWNFSIYANPNSKIKTVWLFILNDKISLFYWRFVSLSMCKSKIRWIYSNANP